MSSISSVVSLIEETKSFKFFSEKDDVLLILVLEVKVSLKFKELTKEFFITLSPKMNSSYNAEFLYIFILDVENIFFIFFDCSCEISSKIGTIKYFIISLYFSSSLCFKKSNPYPIKSYNFNWMNSWNFSD